MKATTWRFAHHRTIDGERCLIWGNGIGEVQVPVASSEYIEALNDRGWQNNALADEGESSMLSVYFQGTTKVPTFYGRLYTSTPTEISTLTTLTGEVAGTGYPGTVSWASNTTDFPTLAKTAAGNTDFQVTSLTKTWTAGSTWTAAASNLVLATVQTGAAGLHIAWVSLTTPRSLVNTDTLDVSVAISLA
jgi:hypothetical protein